MPHYENAGCGNMPFDDPLKNFNERLLIRFDGHSPWKGYFTSILRGITPTEDPPLEDNMGSHYNLRLRTAPPTRREVIFVINAFRQSRITNPDALLTKAPLAELLFPLIRKPW